MSLSMNRRAFLRLSAIAAIEAGLFTAGLGGAAQATPVEKEGLAYLSAMEQLEYFKKGALSPVDVLQAQIARIKEYNGPLNTSGEAPADFMNFNGKVNAITYEFFEEAMKAAKASEERYKAGTARALEGITVAIKDDCEVQGWRSTMGSVTRKDADPAPMNCGVTDKLLEAGAVLPFQTTVPEFYIHTQTWSRLFGVTRNPWNLHYAAGGSSGGSGAALAAGFTTLATGSDMGGSIRIPASLCGLYGFKPPFGRVPTSEISYETLGPLARSFDDMILMQNVIAGPHPKVHSSLRPQLEYPRHYEGLKGMKIGLDYFDTWIEEGLDPAVRDSLTEAAEVLRRQGVEVVEIKLGWKSADFMPVYLQGLLSTGLGYMFLQARKESGELTSYARDALNKMGDSGPTGMAQADMVTALSHQQVQKEVFGKGCLALIMPTLATPYFPADNDPTKDSVLVGGKPVKGSHYALTFIWNLLSRYPVLDVPVGIAPNNIPMGMQVVGNTFDDLVACRVAAAYAQSGIRLYSDKLFPDYRNKE